MKRVFPGALLAVLALAGSAFAGGEPDGSMRVWLDGEYLMWWLKPAPAPEPLLTTGPLTNPLAAGSGVFGSPSSQLLTGNEPFNQGFYNGLRVNAGWMHCSDAWGVEGSFFVLTQHTANVSIGSDALGRPLLARPVVDAFSGAENVLFVSAPGAFSGAIHFASTTELFGGDANVLWPVQRAGDCDDDFSCWFNLLAGARYLNLRENLAIDQSTTVLPAGITFFDGQPVRAPGSLSISDNFHTLNQFYGGQVGAQIGLGWWLFSLNATGKVALGTMYEQARVSGSTTLSSPFGPSQTALGGLLAQSSNIGSFSRNMLAFVPEGRLSLNVEITPQIKLMLGYTFLYVSNVARPGDQIDRVVNRAEVPSSPGFNPALNGPPRPAFNWSGTDFWAQGVNFSIGLRF